MRNIIRSQKGTTIMWSLILISILLVISSSAAILFISELRQSVQIFNSTNAYMAAEAGYERSLNYAYSGNETGGIVTGQYINPSDTAVTYDFEVVKEATDKQYDDKPKRYCDNDRNVPVTNYTYCFFSKGYSHGAVRKLDGHLLTSLTDFKSESFDTSTGTALGSPQKGLYFELNPDLSGTRTPYRLKNTGGIYDLSLLRSKAAKVNYGLYDAAARRGFGFTLEGDSTTSTNIYLKFLGFTYNPSTNIITSETQSASLAQRITVPSTVTKISFVINYRRENTLDDSKNSVSIQINNTSVSPATCLGLFTVEYPYSGTGEVTNPTKALFWGGTAQAAVSSGHLTAYSNLAGATLTIDDLFMKGYYH